MAEAEISAPRVPEAFEPGKTRVLFFSRGRGYGHAMPDMAIVDELEKLREDFDLKLVSYGTGALTFREHRRAVIDLQMPDANPLWTTILKVGQAIRLTHPHLVISHEEFAVLPVARLFGLPTVFITEWFSDPDDLMMQSLSYADEVIVTEEAGIFDEPPNVEGKVFYAGPVLRSFCYSRADRSRARQELGFPRQATIIVVIPGGWATEEKEPVFGLVVRAFEMLDVGNKLLVWLAGADYELLKRLRAGHDSIIVKDRDWQVDRLMVASDLAITKANRVTVRELSALGIPSISISHGHNPVDDVLIERIHTNTPLDARTVSHRLLATTILETLRDGTDRREVLRSPDCQGALSAAHRIADRIAALSAGRARASGCATTTTAGSL